VGCRGNKRTWGSVNTIFFGRGHGAKDKNEGKQCSTGYAVPWRRTMEKDLSEGVNRGRNVGGLPKQRKAPFQYIAGLRQGFFFEGGGTGD